MYCTLGHNWYFFLSTKYRGHRPTSTIQDAQTKYDEPYYLYGENYFVPGNEEVCRWRRSVYRLAKTVCL